jgi:hypothetical protein
MQASLRVVPRAGLVLCALALAHGPVGVRAQGDNEGGVYFPEQIHLTLTGKAGEMAVDWVSSAAMGSSLVMYSDTAPKECFPHFCLNDTTVKNVSAVDVGGAREMTNEARPWPGAVFCDDRQVINSLSRSLRAPLHIFL